MESPPTKTEQRSQAIADHVFALFEDDLLDIHHIAAVIVAAALRQAHSECVAIESPETGKQVLSVTQASIDNFKGWTVLTCHSH